MDNTKKQKTDFAAVIAQGLEIKQKTIEPKEARGLLTDLFRELHDQRIDIQLILATIEEFKAAIEISATENAAAETPAADKVELIGELYQIAIEQTPGDDKDRLTRDLTFFYLANGLNRKFIQWSDILLRTIQKNNIEYRATLFAIGAAQIFVNQWDKAKESFKQLLKDYPDAAEAYFGLALTYLKLGDQRHFQNALEFTRRLSPELGAIIDRFSNQGGFSMNDYMLEMSLLDERNDG